MTDLPEERLDSLTAFTKFGVAYFGSFTVKIGRRNEKKWCCLFICLTMRVLHTEVVLKLDTKSCLNAIMRLIARRDQPSAIIGDKQTFLELYGNFQSMLQNGTMKGSDGRSTHLQHLTFKEYGSSC